MVSADPRVVEIYLTFRDVFTGHDAQVRKLKSVRERVEKVSTRPRVAALLQQHRMNAVSRVLQSLLKTGTFDSATQARVQFPGLFPTTQSQDDGQLAAQAAPANADATLPDMTPAIRKALEARPVVSKPRITHVKQEEVEESTQPGADTCPHYAELLLYPSYIPLPIQLQLLRHTQDLLENACYLFAAKRLPHILQAKGYHHYESVELNIWCFHFESEQKRVHKMDPERQLFAPERVKNIQMPLKDIFRSMAEIRHKAVHREAITAEKLCGLLSDARAFAQLLEHDDAADELAGVHARVLSTTQSIDENRRLVEVGLSVKLDGYEMQKRQIECMEQAVTASAFEEDRQFRLAAAETLKLATQPAPVVVPSSPSVGFLERFAKAVQPGSWADCWSGVTDWF